MDRADLTQQSNSCTTTCGLTSRNSRFGDCGHGAGELTSNDRTLRDVLEARMMKISASARPPSGAKERKAFPLELGDAVPSTCHGYQLQLSSWRGAQDDGRRGPLAEALRIALRIERRLMIGQHEGVVDSEGAELLAV